jgi:hypothetical protein
MNTIDLTKLRNAEYVQMMKDFTAIVERNNPETLNIKARLVSLQEKIGEMDALFKKVLSNGNTPVLLELDQRRDSCITGLYFVTQGYAYHYDDEIRTASQKLSANIRLYGVGIARQSYQAETATLSSIIADWENNTELSSAVTILRLENWLQEMKSLNTQFSETYLDRTQEYGDASPETLFNKRQETNTFYYSLRDRIDALHLLVEAPAVSPYITLINQLNALTNQYNTLLNNRTASGEEAPLPTDDNQ